MCRPTARGCAPCLLQHLFDCLQGALFRLTCLGQNLWAPPGPAPREGSKSGRNSRVARLIWRNTEASDLFRYLLRLRLYDLRRDKIGERTGSIKAETKHFGYLKDH